MAVSFEIDPSAEVETNCSADPVDLANGDPVEQTPNTIDAPSEIDNTPPAEANQLQVNQDATVQAVAATLDASIILKWEIDCQEATKQHTISIDQTKEMMIDLDKEISHATEQLKSLKDQKKGSVERLIQLETRGPELPPKPQPKPIPAATATPADGNNQTSQATSADVKEPSKEPNTNDAWRQIHTLKILDGIERLGEKKRESIVDAFPTLGHLEDIRGEASKEHLHFAEKLPDGIGKTIADKIEERMLDEIAKFSVGLPVVGQPYPDAAVVSNVTLSVVHPDDSETEIPAEDIDQVTGEVVVGDVEYEDVECVEDALADV